MTDRHRTAVRVLMLAALAMLTATMALGRRPSEYEPGFVEVTREVVTPHNPWARPYHRGAVRALMIAPRGCMRDTVELAQRLELDYDAVGTYLRNQLGGGEDRVTSIVGMSPDEVTRRLMEALSSPHDVIVVGNIHWKILPQEVEYEILRQVRAGTGLVLTYHDRGRNEHLNRALEVASEVDAGGAVSDALALTHLPHWQGAEYASHDEVADAAVDTRQFGEGRIALLNLGHGNQSWLVPQTDDDRAWAWEHRWPLEHYLMLTARAITWAARMEPRVRVTAFTALADGAPTDTVAPGSNLQLTLAGGEQGRELQANVIVRDARGTAVAELSETVTADGDHTAMQVPLPDSLLAGRHFAEASIRDGDEAVAWGGASFVIERPRTVVEVTREADSMSPSGTATFEAALDGPAPADAAMHWRLRDGLGRLLHEEVSPVDEGAEAARGQADIERAISNLLVAEATLEVGGEPWARQHGYLPVDQPWPEDRFSFLMWGKARKDYTWAYLRDILYDMGVDTINHGGAVITAANGMRTLPAQRVGLHPNEASEENLIRDPCFSDPAHLEKSGEKLREQGSEKGGFGPVGYTLGDDNRLGRTDICFSEHCLADLREWLQERYDSLEALNAEWGTDFGAWEQVEPTTLADARETDQPARWIDHRMHMESVYADFHAFAREVIREVDPGARVGSDAAIGHGSFGGYDWWKYSRAVDVWNVYVRHFQVENLRSFKQPNTYCGLWYGGYNHMWRFEEGCRWVPWYSLLHDLNSAWWFKTHSDARQSCQEDAFAADLSAFPIFEATADAIDEIKAGIDRLILGAERDNCGIAVVFSQPSVHVGTYEGDGRRHEQAVTAATALVEDLGLEHDLVSYAQLDDGSFADGDYSVVLLPDVTALSTEARQTLADFVEAGGTLIADVRPGVRDGHGKPTGAARWQPLLGVTIGELDGRATGQAGAVAGEIGDSSLDAALQAVTVDAAVEADGATPLGQTEDGVPLILTSESGQGRTCVLNVALGNYVADSEDGAALREIVGALLDQAGVAPLASVEVAGEAQLQGEVITFLDGDARYVAVLRDHTPDDPVQQVTVHLPDGYEVYDVREGEHLGAVSSVEAELGEAELLLLALLPSEVEGIELTVPDAEIAPGEVFSARGRVQVADGEPGRHVLRTTVIGPDGREREYYAEDLVTENASAVAHVPSALDDPAGTWQVQVRDVATGVTAETSFEVGVQ